MSVKELNARKNELLDQQTAVLNRAMEAKVKLTDVEGAAFTASTKEIESIDTNIARFTAIAKGKSEVALPGTVAFVPKEAKSGKQILSAEYSAAFWNALKTRDFSNAALAESTSTSATVSGRLASQSGY